MKKKMKMKKKKRKQMPKSDVNLLTEPSEINYNKEVAESKVVNSFPTKCKSDFCKKRFTISFIICACKDPGRG